jgi:four helix bundle protein
MALAKACYLLTRRFPREELFGITCQIRRSAGSIPANIAEGNGRENTKEYIHFLRIAQGSLKELETHLLLAGEVEICPMVSIKPLLTQADQIGRMLLLPTPYSLIYAYGAQVDVHPPDLSPGPSMDSDGEWNDRGGGGRRCALSGLWRAVWTSGWR